MNKINLLSIGMLVTVVCSCANMEEPLVCNSKENMEYISSTTKDSHIGISEAIEIACEAAEMFNHSTTRSLNTRTIANLDAVHYVTGTATRSERDTLMYVINYNNDEGYAVISKKRIESPLLAVIDKGSFLSLNDLEDTGIKIFFNAAEQYIEDSNLLLKVGPTPEWMYEYKTDTVTYEEIVEPRINVQWGQTGIYGQYCSNGYAGCANTAIAQAMSYFEYPKSISLTYESGTLTLDWSNMKKHIVGTSNYCCLSVDPHIMIGRLMRELGKRSQSLYENGKTTTQSDRVKNVLFGLGYVTGTEENHYKLSIKNRLNTGLLIYWGTDINTGASHMWVADGYSYKKEVMTDYKKRIDNIIWTIVKTWETTQMYNHFNWGLDGKGDGWFQDGVFIPKNSNNNYSQNVKFITVIN